ncbi:hypothetical protein [Aromatoleum diolicum]|uniref:Secreted protein n=1 Tax=Aromatoleum diolicum TaxID=75796 RepID=A0ABX1QC76_9RHOO|nr:hypothetical protein [Aromatoleum diolicum]NMG74606.1 hypothetical protein [Aromatoleum diolicum]
MRLSTFAVLVYLACAPPTWADTGQPQRPRGDRPVASEPATAPETTDKDASKEGGGFWNWLRTGNTGSSDKDAAADRLERPDRVERPVRVERPERAGGGCCQ